MGQQVAQLHERYVMMMMMMMMMMTNQILQMFFLFQAFPPTACRNFS